MLYSWIIILLLLCSIDLLPLHILCFKLCLSLSLLPLIFFLQMLLDFSQFHAYPQYLLVAFPFLKTFYFEIVSNLQKNCKKGTENSCMLILPRFHQLFTFSPVSFPIFSICVSFSLYLSICVHIHICTHMHICAYY